MKCLWLMVADPDPPINGEFVFSGGLLRAIAPYFDSIHVVAFSLPSGIHADGEKSGNITWHLAQLAPRSAWLAVFSSLPRDVFRTRTDGFRQRVGAMLRDGGWDVVVFATPKIAWAFDSVTRACPDAVTVYVSHNHEETVARSVVEHEADPLKRQIHLLDVRKVRRTERHLTRRADLVTATCSEDAAKFSRVRSASQRGDVEFLTPGYSGEHVSSRTISNDIPRRVIIIGSLDWVPKRQAFEQFLAEADARFAQAGIELYVVGGAPDEYLDTLRRKFTAAVFTGHVSDVSSLMRQARIGLVIENVGGFKLKTLDYVFNRLPIFARRGSLPGIPLGDRSGALLFDSYAELASSIVDHIDDFDLLNTMHDEAYAASAGQFDWERIAQTFVSYLEGSNRKLAVRDRRLLSTG